MCVKDGCDVFKKLELILETETLKVKAKKRLGAGWKKCI